jgi:hypothetical protein
MQLTAKLIQLLPLQTGTGKNGEWRKQDVIVETDGQYPKKVCISIWGDKIDSSQLVVGNMITIDFDLESREYNGRWFTDVKAWKVSSQGEAPRNELGGIEPLDLSDDDDGGLPF